MEPIGVRTADRCLERSTTTQCGARGAPGRPGLVLDSTTSRYDEAAYIVVPRADGTEALVKHLSPPRPSDDLVTDREMQSSGVEAQVTIAVVSWNTRDLLAECLESLYYEVSTDLAEVWVVDNASSDGSVQLVHDQFPWVKLIASTQNLGFGAAVNTVATRTSSTWLAPANADIRLTPNALERLVAEGERYPEAAVIAPRLVLPDGTTQPSVYPFPTIPFTLAYASSAIDHSHRLARYWCIDSGFDPDVGREVAWAVGAFLLVRRSAWDGVGGFDETRWMYAEDLDLGWRLQRAGWRTRYTPEAWVFHFQSAATVKAWGDVRHTRWHGATYAWLAQTRGFTIARIIAATNVLCFLCRAGLSAFAALLGRSSSRSARQHALNTARAHVIGLRSRSLLEQIR